MSTDREPETLPQILKDLLNSEGYESLKEALEDTAKKIKSLKEREDENQQTET